MRVESRIGFRRQVEREAGVPDVVLLEVEAAGMRRLSKGEEKGAVFDAEGHPVHGFGSPSTVDGADESETRSAERPSGFTGEASSALMVNCILLLFLMSIRCLMKFRRRAGAKAKEERRKVGRY